MLTTDRNQQLDDLLWTSIAEFDIPDPVYARAIARYEHLAHWLAGFWPDSHAGGEVYPQGSIRLGTVTCPVNPRDEIDVDLVCRRDLLETSITKQELKDDVIRLCSDCADTWAATARIVARQAAPSLELIRATIEACSAPCAACAEECDRHAAHHEHCRLCSEVCRRCKQACDDLLAVS